MIVKKYVLVRACMSFECTEEFSVSSYGAAYMYIRQLEPYHVPPFSLPPSLTISGATAAVPKVFLFVAGFVTTKRAAAEGPTQRRSLAAVAKNNGVGACDSDSGDGTRLKRQVNSFGSGDGGSDSSCRGVLYSSITQNF